MDNEIFDEKLEKLVELAKRNWLNKKDAFLEPEDKRYKITKIDILKIHDYIFKYTPPMHDDEFETFVEDIAINGQIEPIKVWNKAGSLFVVDGRNRIKALHVLGVKYVKFVNVSIKNLEELKTKIISWDKRRTTTKVQRAVLAYNDYLQGGSSMDEVANKFGVSKAFISYCKNIHNLKGGGKGYLDELLNKGYTKYKGKIYKALFKLYEAIKKDSTEPPKVGSNVPEHIREYLLQLNELKKNRDIVGLAYIVDRANKYLNEVQNDI